MTAVAVIGGGIVGVTTAWELRRRGADVTLIDGEGLGRGASFGNAGAISHGSVAPLAMPGVLRSAIGMLLDPEAPLHIPRHYWLKAAPWLYRFVRAARPAEVQRIAEALSSILANAVDRHVAIAREVGAPELIQRTGQLHLYPDEAQLAKDAGTWTLRKQHGLQVDRLDRDGILALEPAIGPRYGIGLFTPEQGMSVNPYRQVLKIGEDFVRQGGRVLQDRVTAIETDGTAVTGVQCRTGRYSAEHVVICAGAWSAALLRPLGYRVPLETQRGYHVMVPDPGVAIRRTVVAADRKVFLTPMEDGLRAAGTVEFGGLAHPPTRRRAELLVGHLAGVLPDAKIPQDWTSWMGHRPCLPDSLPVVGPSSRHRGLWFGFGHGHLGLTMSAATGDILGRGITGEPGNIDLAPFAIERFG